MYTGRSLRAATRMAAADAWAVPMTLATLCWLKTRSTATALMMVQMSSDLLVDVQKTVGDVVVGRRGDDIDGHHAARSAGETVDDPHPAPGQPRIDSHHTQLPPLPWHPLFFTTLLTAPDIDA